MEKKKLSMYDWMIGGYYVMSVVLGLLLAFSLAMVMEVAVMDICLSTRGALSNFMEEAWCYLPMGVCDFFYYHGGWYWQTVLMVTTSILTVAMFVRMVDGAKKSTKVMQTVGVALLVLLGLTAYRWAFRSSIHGSLAVIPVLLMVLPLTILRNKQQRTEIGELTPWQKLHNLCIVPKYKLTAFATEFWQTLELKLGAFWAVLVTIVIICVAIWLVCGMLAHTFMLLSAAF